MKPAMQLVGVFVLLSLVVRNAVGVYYRTTFINNLDCKNGTVVLAVDSSSSYSANYVAGKIVMSSKPIWNCTFLLSVVDSSYVQGNMALYFNVREQHLSSLSQKTESLEIYENTTSGYTPTLVKRMTASIPSSYPRSFDQLRTRFTSKPSLLFKFNLDTEKDYTFGSYLQLDWTLVMSTQVYSGSQSSSYCSALNGYVRDELRCDDSDSDRVNCPYSYSPTISRNPVITTDHLNSYSYQCDSYNHDYYYLSDGAYVGIAFASFFVLFAVVGLVRRAYRGPRTRVVYNRNTAPNGAGAFVTITSPTVVGMNNGNYPQQQGQGFTPMPQPPPCYDQVYPQTVIKQ